MPAPLQALTEHLDSLSTRCPVLIQGIRQAIAIGQIDPEMALTRSRKALDYIVREVYQRRLNEPPGTRPLDNLLQRLVKDGHWPTRLAAYANTVRELGNVGTHTFGEPITPTDVLRSLEQLVPIVDWFLEQDAAAPGGTTGAESAADWRTDRLGLAMGDTTAVVPKGLRSFDARDSDFFLTLVPGARDRAGLPESIRFWKDRTDPAHEAAFTVGLLYGPSGCGKSSLVKAGLLPRLSPSVQSVYVEATSDDTEARILKGLRRRFPQLPTDAGLVQSFVLLFSGSVLPAGQKVLLVLDQFEQWLHARRAEEQPELVQALRQCDGAHVQCLVMVRDDFWLAVSRFLRQLEIQLLEGQNTALVDLFDLLHARKVLTLFGQAHGRLPDDAAAITAEQHQFIDQAVAGLAQDGKVIPVRLALFAEMVKGKAWSPVTLRDVGGTEGIGVTFLEENFTASSAPAEHRLHQKAVRAVLSALLPEKGSDIKGHMRSREELLEASEYAGRPQHFDALMRILDPELRLVTPTDPAGLESDETPAAPRPQFYQLTHDYLVGPLREWLRRKQRESRRGRAELRLADRVALWVLRPESRHLPSVREWFQILLLTRRRDWHPPERRMMRAATRRYTLFGLVLAVGLGLLGAGTWFAYSKQAAAGQIEALKSAEIGQVPDIVARIASHRTWTDPALREMLHGNDNDPQASKEHLYASLALLPVDPSQNDYIIDRLLTADFNQFPTIRDLLKAYSDPPTNQLWQVLEDGKADAGRRFRAGMALAKYVPPSADDARWQAVAPFLVDQLLPAMVSHPLDYKLLLEAFRPGGAAILAPLGAAFRDTKRPDSQRTYAMNLLVEYAADQPDIYAGLLMDAEPGQYVDLLPKVQALELADKVIPVLEAELARVLTPTWRDAPTRPGWSAPDAGLSGPIESAGGLVNDHFALCQTMPLEQCAGVADRLRPCGFRPVGFRPYRCGDQVQVAALWTRDGRDWRLAYDRTAADLATQDQTWKAQGFIPADVAGYESPAAAGQLSYAALWIKPPLEISEARLYVGVAAGAGLPRCTGPASQGRLPATDRDGKCPGRHELVQRRLVEAETPGRRGSPRLRVGTKRNTLCQQADCEPAAAGCALVSGRSAAVAARAGRALALLFGLPASGSPLLPLPCLGLSEAVLQAQPRDWDYGGVWYESTTMSSQEAHGLAPADHLARCRDLAQQGYRPMALTVACAGADKQAGSGLGLASAGGLRRRQGRAGPAPGPGRHHAAAPGPARPSAATPGAETRPSAGLVHHQPHGPPPRGAGCRSPAAHGDHRCRSTAPPCF